MAVILYYQSAKPDKSTAQDEARFDTLEQAFEHIRLKGADLPEEIREDNRFVWNIREGVERLRAIIEISVAAQKSANANGKLT